MVVIGALHSISVWAGFFVVWFLVFLISFLMLSSYNQSHLMSTKEKEKNIWCKPAKKHNNLNRNIPWHCISDLIQCTNAQPHPHEKFGQTELFGKQGINLHNIKLPAPYDGNNPFLGGVAKLWLMLEKNQGHELQSQWYSLQYFWTMIKTTTSTSHTWTFSSQ